MLLLFSIRVAEWPPFREGAVHSVYCASLSWQFVKLCVCSSFPFGIEVRMWDVILLFPDHCLSVFTTIRIISLPGDSAVLIDCVSETDDCGLLGKAYLYLTLISRRIILVERLFSTIDLLDGLVNKAGRGLSLPNKHGSYLLTTM